MASFANKKGGYILFGIENDSHEIIGLKTDKFKNCDPKEISLFIDIFSPEIRWEKTIYEINSKKIGIIYVFESEEKPIICERNGGELKEGDIYYRYPGINKRIKYRDLKKILDDQKEKHIKILMEHIRKIVQIGVSKVEISDITSQKDGEKNTKMLDIAAIPNMKFIEEGNFNEINGEPTLKLNGSVNTGIVVPQGVSINTERIIEAFLTENLQNIDPLQYINQLPYESTHNLPLYFFITQSRLSRKQIIDKIQESKSTKDNIKNKLKERLEKNEENFSKGNIKANTSAAYKKRNFRQKIIDKEKIILEGLDQKDLRYLLEAITHLKKEEIHSVKKGLLSLLQEFFEKYYATSKTDSNLDSTFRHTICHIDYMTYGIKTQKD